MRRLIPVTLVFIALSGVAGMDFRVTAVYGVQSQGLFAVVETADGRHHTVRAGGEIDGLRVSNVVPEGIEVEVDGAPRLIRLDGGAGQLAGEQGVAASELVPLLHQDQIGGPGQRLRGIDELVGLQMGAEITEIADQPVVSPEQAMEVLRRTLRPDQPVRLLVRGDPDRQVLYLVSESGTAAEVPAASPAESPAPPASD